MSQTYERLTSIQDLDNVLASGQRVVLFKHSLTCPVSTAAFREYQKYLAETDETPATYTLIEVQNARDVSNEIAARLGVKHESPQALVVEGGSNVLWHASHWSITKDSLTNAIH